MSHNGTQFGGDYSINTDFDGLRSEFDDEFDQGDERSRRAHDTCDCAVTGTGLACCV